MICAKCNRRIYCGPGIVTRRRKGELEHSHRICPGKPHEHMKMGQRRPARKVQGNHGAKRDYVETRRRGYVDPDSFASLDGREFLAGVDWAQRKIDLCERADGKCQWPVIRRYVVGYSAEPRQSIRTT